MVHASFRFPSRALGRNTDFHVLLPKPQSLFTDEKAPMALPEKKCLWFFHGVGDDAEAVLLHTEIADLCDAHDLIVILPSVENSFCLDISDSLRFRAYLLDELIPYTMKIFSLSPEREKHLIGGISMGGYGACSLGLSRPEFFAKIFCLSGALDIKAAARFSRACGIPLAEPVAARDAPETHPDWDLIKLLEAMAGHPAPPEIRLTCSELDSVWKSNLRFAERGRELGLPVALHAAPGLHDWKFWRENLSAAVEWAVRGSGIPAA